MSRRRDAGLVMSGWRAALGALALGLLMAAAAGPVAAQNQVPTLPTLPVPPGQVAPPNQPVSPPAAPANVKVQVAPNQRVQIQFQPARAPNAPNRNLPGQVEAAAPSGDDLNPEQFLEISEKAASLIKQASEESAAANFDGAVKAILELLEISAESVLPTVERTVRQAGPAESNLGVRQAARQLVLKLPPEGRKVYEQAAAPQAESALQSAERSMEAESGGQVVGGAGGGSAAGRFAAVAARYPGTVAGRLAAVKAWAMAFEDGRFEQAAEQVELYLADAEVTDAERRAALIVAGLAALEAGQLARAEVALAQLRLIKTPGTVTLAGQQVDAAQYLQGLLKQPAARPGTWNNVGGDPARKGFTAVDLQLGGHLVIGQSGATEGLLKNDRLPSRREILQSSQQRPTGATEHEVLATEKVFLVRRGNQLLGYDRVSGDELWRRQLSPADLGEAMPAIWPSAGDGYVAVMMMPDLRLEQAGNAFIMGMRRLDTSASRRLVVLHEETGRTAWAWGGTSGTVAAAAEEPPAAGPAPRLEDLQAPPGKLADQLAAPEPTAPAPAAPAAAPAPGPTPAAPAPAAAAPADNIELFPTGSPLIYGGRVFVGAASLPQAATTLVDCYLVCFDLRSGRIEWRRFLGSGRAAVYSNGGNTFDRMIPTTDGRRVFIESAVGTLAAVNLATTEVDWIHCYDRPNGNSPWDVTPTDWPSGVSDAPIVSHQRLLVTDVSGPKLLALETATGAVAWEVRLAGQQRHGVSDQLLLTTGGQTVHAYDLARGREVFSRPLPGEVIGRGFVTKEAVYLPTEKAVVRVELTGGKMQEIYDYSDGGGSSYGLAPAGEIVVSSHQRQMLLLGPMDRYFAEVKRQCEANPRDPTWSRRLAELYRQQGDFASAERWFESSVRLASQLRSGEESRDLQLAAYRRLERVYEEWAAALLKQGQGAEAARKLEKAMQYAVTPEAQVSAQMALGRTYETLGDTVQAGRSYARIAALEPAGRMMVATVQPGLERSLATEAGLALARLGAARAASPQPVGLRAADLTRLAAQQVAMMTWPLMDGGAAINPFGWNRELGQVMADETETFAPLVWSRLGSVVAFGPAGEIRWRYSRPELRSEDQFLTVKVRSGLAIERKPAGLTAFRLRDGTVAWQWSPGHGRNLVASANGGMMRRGGVQIQVVQVNGQQIVVQRSGGDETFGRDISLTISDQSVLSVSAAERGGAVFLHRVALATGQGEWSYRPRAGEGLVAVAVAGGRVVLALGTANLRERVICLNEANGEELWAAEREGPRAAAVRSLGRPVTLLVDKNLVVAAGSLDGPWAIEMKSGRPLWQQKDLVDKQVALAMTPVAIIGQATICDLGRELAALSNLTGQRLWTYRDADLPSRENPQLQWAEAGELLIVAAGRQVTALRLADGQVEWQHELAGGQSQQAGRAGLAGLVSEEAGEYEVLVTGDVVTVYGKQERQCLLRFLDRRSGKLLGRFEAGSASGPVTVTPISGGLFVQCGNELLTIRPAAAGAAVGGGSPGGAAETLAAAGSGAELRR